MIDRRLRTVVLALILAPVTACEAPADDTGADVPVAFLQERVREVLDDVERARSALPDDVPEASTRLEDSHLKLRRLDEYYLPLLAARAQVATALGAVDAGDAGDGSAGAAVDSAEAALLGIMRGHGRHLEKEMREPLARLEEVRAALSADDVEEARRLLRSLRHHLESIFFRGDLVLEGSELDPQ